MAEAFEEEFTEQSAEDYAEAQDLPSIAPTPFRAFDPASLPRRQWLYGRHYCAGFVSVTAARGGEGKTQRSLAEACAIASGVPILGEPVPRRLRVWHYNLEDPLEELERRVAAIVQNAQERDFDIDLAMLEGWLFLNSGRERSRRLIIAEQQGSNIVATPHAEELLIYIKENRIGILQADPLVRCHTVEENNNGAMDKVMGLWTDCAEQTGCAIDLLHHIRKTSNERASVEDTRGGGAIIGAARTIRMMNRMSEQEAKTFGIKTERERLRMIRTDPTAKANMLPPAGHAQWHQFISVQLPNHTTNEPGDNVGVIIPWTPPDAWEGVTSDKIQEFLTRVEEKADSDEPYSPNPNATKRWVGKLAMNLFNKEDGPAGTLIKEWIKNDVLEEFECIIDRKSRKAVRRGSAAPGSHHD